MNATPGSMAEALPDIERVREARAKLAEAGVRCVLSCWIDMLGVPKTKPVPLGNFENLCMGKGPQFAVHSVSFVPELTPADSDQIPVPDLDTLVICPWDRTCAWMTEVLGPTMLDSYLRYKADEWERYHRAVTDWEVEEYLRLY